MPRAERRARAQAHRLVPGRHQFHHGRLVGRDFSDAAEIFAADHWPGIRQRLALHADHDGKHLNILDAPGYPDFIGAALEALSAVETAVVVVSAVPDRTKVTASRVLRKPIEVGKLLGIVEEFCV